MATSKKKAEERARQQAFEKNQQGMIDKAERDKAESVVSFSDEDLVVVEIQNKLKPFMKFSLLHSWRTKKVSYLGSSVICLLAAAYYIWQGVWSNSAIFLVLAVVFPLALAGLHMLSARAQLKNDDEFHNTKHTYFFREDEFASTSKYQNHVGTYQEKYSELAEAIDKGDYVYLYVNKGTAFVIEKANFLKGDINEFERLLSKINGYVK